MHEHLYTFALPRWESWNFCYSVIKHLYLNFSRHNIIVTSVFQKEPIELQTQIYIVAGTLGCIVLLVIILLLALATAFYR